MVLSISATYGMQKQQLQLSSAQLQQGIYTRLNSHEDQLRKNTDQINALEKILKDREEEKKILAEAHAIKDNENAKKLKELTAENTQLQNSVSNLQAAAIGTGIFAGLSALVGLVWLVDHQETLKEHKETLNEHGNELRNHGYELRNNQETLQKFANKPK